MNGCSGGRIGTRWNEGLGSGRPRGLSCPREQGVCESWGAGAPTLGFLDSCPAQQDSQAARVSPRLAHSHQQMPASRREEKNQPGASTAGGSGFTQGVCKRLLTTDWTLCVRGHLNHDAIGTEQDKSESGTCCEKRKPTCII